MKSLPPHRPLTFPIRLGGDGAEVLLEEGVAAVFGVGQEEDGLLDVGGQVGRPIRIVDPSAKPLTELFD